MRFIQTNQNYHHFPQFPAQHNISSQYIHHSQLPLYPNHWNQNRKNQSLRMGPVAYEDKSQYQNYQKNNHYASKSQQSMAQIEQPYQNQYKIQAEQKEIERKNKEKEEAKKQAKKQ